jgi:hypothetical protein
MDNYSNQDRSATALLKELQDEALLRELESRLDKAFSGSKFAEVLEKFNAFEGFEIFFNVKSALFPDEPRQLFVLNCCRMGGGLKCPWPQ